MATVAITSVTRLHGKLLVTWETLTTGDEGEVFEPPAGYQLDSMQFIGDFGSGTAKLQGSNVPGGAGAFEDIEDTGATAGGFIFPVGQALFFRPELSGGSAGDVDVYALFAER